MPPPARRAARPARARARPSRSSRRPRSARCCPTRAGAARPRRRRRRRGRRRRSARRRRRPPAADADRDPDAAARRLCGFLAGVVRLGACGDPEQALRAALAAFPFLPIDAGEGADHVVSLQQLREGRERGERERERREGLSRPPLLGVLLTRGARARPPPQNARARRRNTRCARSLCCGSSRRGRTRSAGRSSSPADASAAAARRRAPRRAPRPRVGRVRRALRAHHARDRPAQRRGARGAPAASRALPRRALRAARSPRPAAPAGRILRLKPPQVRVKITREEFARGCEATALGACYGRADLDRMYDAIGGGRSASTAAAAARRRGEGARAGRAGPRGLRPAPAAAARGAGLAGGLIAAALDRRARRAVVVGVAARVAGGARR